MATSLVHFNGFFKVLQPGTPLTASHFTVGQWVDTYGRTQERGDKIITYLLLISAEIMFLKVSMVE